MNKNCHRNNKIINAFMESLQKRCTTYELNAVFKMSAIMNPRFKLTCCQDEGEPLFDIWYKTRQHH